MRNVIVCLSGINVDKRTEIHKLVGFMGGMFTKDLIESTTHLITNTIKSPKYEVCVIFFTLFVSKFMSLELYEAKNARIYKVNVWHFRRTQVWLTGSLCSIATENASNAPPKLTWKKVLPNFVLSGLKSRSSRYSRQFSIFICTESRLEKHENHEGGLDFPSMESEQKRWQLIRNGRIPTKIQDANLQQSCHHINRDIGGW